MAKTAAAAVSKKQAKVSLIRLIVLPSPPAIWLCDCGGLEKAKNLAGRVLRPIQTASSEAEFQENLTYSSSTIAPPTTNRFVHAHAGYGNTVGRTASSAVRIKRTSNMRRRWFTEY